MSWSGSKRKDELPTDWQFRVAAVKQRANGMCQGTVRIVGTIGNKHQDFKQCPEIGTDCDHIIRGSNHNLDNLQLLCSWHHGRKTAREGVEARKLRRKPHESKHPGEK